MRKKFSKFFFSVSNFDIFHEREQQYVKTPYGIGYVLDYRNDGIFEIQLSFGISYCNKHDVLQLCVTQIYY